MARENKPRGAPFRASEVQREYRLLLDRAKQGSVQIIDKDGSVLGIQPWPELEFEHRLHELAAACGQFRTAHETHHDQPASEWADLTPFPWIDSLHADEIDEFVGELTRLTFSAAGRNDLAELEGCINAFRSTAATYRAPGVLASMLGEGEPVEIFPPSQYGYSEGE